MRSGGPQVHEHLCQLSSLRLSWWPQHLVERFTPITRDAINYEVMIEDPKVLTRPWKISVPLYRRLEPNAQLLEYRCMEFVEEFLWGNLRKQQLVKRWQGQTMIVDITRKVPPADKLHDWYRR